MNTLTLPVESETAFLQTVEKLNRKCARFGLPAIEASKQGTPRNETKTVHSIEIFEGKERRKIFEFPVLVQDWQIDREIFTVGNWQFVAKVETLDSGKNIFHAVPDSVKVPKHYIETGCRCEHCNVNRYRKTTYIVKDKDSDSFRQVGSTCLTDFLGKDFTSAFAFESEIWNIINLAAESFYGSFSDRNWINIETTFAEASNVIRANGFRSKKAEGEGQGISTATLLLRLKETGKLTVEDCDKQKAKDVIDWINTFDVSSIENEYLEKLFYLVDAGSCEGKNLGIIVSAVSAYDRHLQKIEDEKRKGKSEYVGTVKKREDFSLVCVSVIALPDYGFGPSFVNIFRDEKENCLTWKTSFSFEVGESVKLKGTVKEHAEYRGEKQTVLTRCKVLS